METTTMRERPEVTISAPMAEGQGVFAPEELASDQPNDVWSFRVIEDNEDGSSVVIDFYYALCWYDPYDDDRRSRDDASVKEAVVTARYANVADRESGSPWAEDIEWEWTDAAVAEAACRHQYRFTLVWYGKGEG